MGFGSFLAFYLADMGWSKQDVGVALTVGGSPAWRRYSRRSARRRRALEAGTGGGGNRDDRTSALILALWPSFLMVLVAEACTA